MKNTYFLLNDYIIDQVVMRNCGDVCGKKTGWQPKYALLVPKNIRRRSEKYNEICAIIG